MRRVASLLVGEVEGGLGWAGRVGEERRQGEQRAVARYWRVDTPERSKALGITDSRARQQPRGQAAMDKEHARKCPGHSSAEGVVIKQMLSQGGWKLCIEGSFTMTPAWA